MVLAGDGKWMVGGFGWGLEWCRIWRKGGENKHIFKNNWVDFFLILPPIARQYILYLLDQIILSTFLAFWLGFVQQWTCPLQGRGPL